MVRPLVLSDTPAALGYTFPPEWAPHTGTWFSWPRPEGISFPDKYDPVPANLARIMREIAPREQVHINVPGADDERLVRAQLAREGVDRNLFFHHVLTNECWCRDHGPAFVLRPGGGRAEAAIVDWGFNAWGGKYPPWEADDAVPSAVAAELGLPVFEPGIVMEGGAVDFNGRGTVLTTTSCLLNPNRNPGLSRQRIEQYLLDYYGQRHVVWLGDGIAGDDTDGHVDDLARFIDASTVVIGIEEDPADENHEVLRDNLARLGAARDQDGRPFEVVTVPMPPPVLHDGQRLPATYVNFYFVNGALLVPTYRAPERDAAALDILQRHLPRHQVIGIDCVDLIWGLGAIHCLTQQQPRY
jgi:agmatine deiminase